VSSNIVNDKNAGMIESAGGAGLLLEALQAAGIGGEGGWQNFDGHLAAQARVASAVHFAHATGTKWCLDLIGPEFRSRGQSHNWERL